MVRELGVPVATGYDASHLDWCPDVVVVGNALSRGNAEVEATLERRLRYVSLPEWLKGIRPSQTQARRHLRHPRQRRPPPPSRPFCWIALDSIPAIW